MGEVAAAGAGGRIGPDIVSDADPDIDLRPHDTSPGRPDRRTFSGLSENLMPPALPTFTVNPLAPDRQTLSEARIKLAYQGVAGTAALASLLVWLDRQMVLGRDQHVLFVAAATGLLAMFAALLASRFHLLTSRLREAGSTTGAPEQAAAPAGRNPAELLAEQSRTIAEQVLIYQQITTRQARTAFRSSISAMSLALVALGLGAALSVGGRDLGVRVVAAAISGLGVALTGFLGKTFLDMHRRATEQLNRSHAIPLAQHMAYFSFMLAHTVDGRPRDELVSDIVATTLKGVELTLAGFLTERPDQPGRGRRFLGTRTEAGRDA